MNRRQYIATVATTGGVVIAGCSSEEQEPTQTTTSKTTTEESTTESEETTSEETASEDSPSSVTLEAKNVSPPDSTATLQVSYTSETKLELATDPATQAEEGYKWLITKLSITNKGDELHEITPSSYVVSVEGKLYEFVVTNGEHSLRGKEVSPGETVTGNIVFHIPMETRTGTLTVRNGVNGSRPVTVTFSRSGETASEETTSENAVRFVNHEWTTIGNGSPAVKGKMRNVTDSELDVVRIRADFVDDSGTILEQGLGLVQFIASGDTHVFRILYIGENADRVSDYSLSTTTRRDIGVQDNRGEINIQSHSTTTFEFGGWGVSGTIENTTQQTLAEVEIYGHFYQDDDLVEFTGADVVSEFDPSDRYEFEIQYNGYLKKSDIDRYTLKVVFYPE